ncbi:kinase-like protein [Serendipita vermifera]|nr:kinase-like protein [Serendipita vermifera]
MWDHVERGDGTRREKGLAHYFRSKLHDGCQLERFHNSSQSAWEIINNLLEPEPLLGPFTPLVSPSSNLKSSSPIRSDKRTVDSPYESPSLPTKTTTVVPGKSPLLGTRNAIRVDVKGGNAVKSRLSPPELSGQVQKLKRNLHFYGTYSNVYHGEYKGQKVAIKEIRAVGVKRVTDRKFQRELQIWWKLRHTNILPLFGYIDEDDSIQTYNALISPWIAGGNAAEYIRGEVSASQRLGLFYDVVKGLEYLHNFNPVVVHGDLKPLNVLVTPEGVGQICDFGLTRLIQEEETTGLTTTTAHAGTARYLAYELVVKMGDPEALPTTATDIYALGCLGMEFICSTPPHHLLGNNLALIYRTIGDGHPPVVLPDDDDGNISLLWDLLERCWATRPIDRPTVFQIRTRLKSNGQLILDALNKGKWTSM